MRVLALHRTHKNFFFSFFFIPIKIRPACLDKRSRPKKRKKFGLPRFVFIFYFLLRGSDSAAAADGHPIHQIILVFFFFFLSKIDLNYLNFGARIFLFFVFWCCQSSADLRSPAVVPSYRPPYVSAGLWGNENSSAAYIIS